MYAVCVVSLRERGELFPSRKWRRWSLPLFELYEGEGRWRKGEKGKTATDQGIETVHSIRSFLSLIVFEFMIRSDLKISPIYWSKTDDLASNVFLDILVSESHSF